MLRSTVRKPDGAYPVALVSTDSELREVLRKATASSLHHGNLPIRTEACILASFA